MNSAGQSDAGLGAGMARPTRGGRWRPRVQALSLVLFILLALSVWVPWKTWLSHDLFLWFDPLVWLLNTLAARQVAPHALFALTLLLVTVLLGRVFCGWVCPLGTAIDATHVATGRKSNHPVSSRLSSLRFWVLAGLIGAAIVGANFGHWLDPLVFSARALRLAPLAGEDWRPVLLAGTLVVAAIGLTLVAPRFWCRTLCPLGAALSLVARFSWYRRRIAKTCAGCGVCTDVCPLRSSPTSSSTADCLLCRRCEAVCPQQAIAFGFGAGLTSAVGQPTAGQPLDPCRRKLLLSLGGLVIGGAVGRASKGRNEQRPLRPPGAPDEAQFVARCIGCGACMAVCPTGGLQPMLTLDRIEAVFSPELVPRVGPCLPHCRACGAACPTAAIAKVSAERKLAIRIGLAVIDEKRCLPWASQQRCVICLDACPPEFQAIELRRVGPGEFRPCVMESRCTGCGICEHRCPVEGEAAIRVRRALAQP